MKNLTKDQVQEDDKTVNPIIQSVDNNIESNQTYIDEKIGSSKSKKNFQLATVAITICLVIVVISGIFFWFNNKEESLVNRIDEKIETTDQNEMVDKDKEDNEETKDVEETEIYTIQGGDLSQIGSRLVFAPNSEKFVYDYRDYEEGKSYLNVNGEVNVYDKVREYVFSDDGKHFAYAIGKDGKDFIYLDGKEISNDKVSKITFSPNGMRVAYATFEKGPGNPMAVFIDGKKSPIYNEQVTAVSVPDSRSGNGSFKNFVFSSDSKRVAYIAKKNNKEIAIIDGKEIKAYDQIHYFSFSPDGKQYVLSVQNGRNYFIVLNGKEVKTYSGMYRAFFDDSSRLIFQAKSGRDSFVVVGGKEGQKHQDASIETIAISLKEDKVAYSIYDNKKMRRMVFVNGKEVDENAIIKKFFFDKKGKIGYAASYKNESYVKIGDRKETVFSDINDFKFSKNKNHYLYVGFLEGSNYKDGQRKVIIDGQEGEAYDKVYDVHFTEDENKVIYKALLGNKILLVIHNLN